MTQPAILVENLGKRYQIGTREQGARTLRETLVDLAQAPLRRLRSLSGSDETAEEFWAIRNLSFAVQPGDVMGVIGRNGAGKSTLLKLLSRISEPTEGRAVIRGRVASLLEVGTGFHNELSGRENIFLNGAILGMPKSEIVRKFDEIVEFSGVGKFLDTPIKRYSSGMKVRLAFAVAAHLEPEILIIDEVLAVGDVDFQNKCMGKMRNVAQSGRTVIFVSHNIAAVQALCRRAILLEGGTLTGDGPTECVLEKYLKNFQGDRTSETALSTMSRTEPSRQRLMLSGKLINAQGAVVTGISIGDSLTISVTYQSETASLRPVLGVVVKNSMGVALFGTDNRIQAEFLPTRPCSCGKIELTFDSLPLYPGVYTIDLYMGDEVRSLDSIESAMSFEVTSSNYMGAGKLPSSGCGSFLVKGSWFLQDQIENESRPPSLAQSEPPRDRIELNE